MQWAAVMAQWAAMTLQPHQWRQSLPRYRTLPCHGHECASAWTPPTIREFLGVTQPPPHRSCATDIAS